MQKKIIKRLLHLNDFIKYLKEHFEKINNV